MLGLIPFKKNKSTASFSWWGVAQLRGYSVRKNLQLRVAIAGLQTWLRNMEGWESGQNHNHLKKLQLQQKQQINPIVIKIEYLYILKI